MQSTGIIAQPYRDPQISGSYFPPRGFKNWDSSGRFSDKCFWGGCRLHLRPSVGSISRLGDGTGDQSWSVSRVWTCSNLRLQQGLRQLWEPSSALNTWLEVSVWHSWDSGWSDWWEMCPGFLAAWGMDYTGSNKVNKLRTTIRTTNRTNK